MFQTVLLIIALYMKHTQWDAKAHAEDFARGGDRPILGAEYRVHETVSRFIRVEAPQRGTSTHLLAWKGAVILILIQLLREILFQSETLKHDGSRCIASWRSS